MITQLKTALLGDGLRADGGTTYPSRGVTDAEDPDTAPGVGDIDPFHPATDSAASATHDHVEMDQVFDILGIQRRRYVLKYLSMTEGPIPLDDLAEQIAAREYRKVPAQLAARERKRVCVNLYQCHLPKMAGGSAISYDQEQDTIEHGERFDHFSSYLRHEANPASGRPGVAAASHLCSSSLRDSGSESNCSVSGR